MRKMPTLLFLCLLITNWLAGCGGSEPGTGSLIITEPEEASESVMSVSEQLRIALVMKTLTNPFFVAMEQGARQAEEEFGVELIVKTAAQETSIAQQINIVEELIRDEVDAIVIAPGDSFELVPVVKRAQDAGIVVINIDNQLDMSLSAELGLANIPFISVNNEEAAYMSARYISEQITTPTAVAILEGIRGAKNAEERKNGALRAFAENPNITVVEQETANWKIDEAYEVATTMFAENPQIGGVFAANDMMALGLIQYLDEVGREDVLVAGFDALEEAEEAISEGMLAVTIDQQADEQGYLGVLYAIRALNGEQLPAETYINTIVVTENNLQSP